MSDKQLTELIRKVIKDLDGAKPDKAPQVVAPLRAAGITPGMHQGAGEFSGGRMTLEWYAGQILEVIDVQAWHCVNSVINVCDKFAPAVG